MEIIHVVQQGEYLSLIAKRYGFATWQALYNHPKNANFKTRRPNPNLLYPGDEIVIPDRGVKEESAQTEKLHEYKLAGPKQILRVGLLDRAGKPLAKRKYKVIVDEVEHPPKETTDAGLVECSIAADAQQATLTVWMDGDMDGAGTSWNIMIGHLDPLEEISGLKGRLLNLGYDCGKADSNEDEQTAEAIRQFQQTMNIPVSGKFDDTTRDKLRTFHDGD